MFQEVLTVSMDLHIQVLSGPNLTLSPEEKGNN